MNLDAWERQLLGGVHLSERDMRRLCAKVIEVMVKEQNIVSVSSPVTICGDIHGQFPDLVELLRIGGQVSDGTKYIFLGDLVDRGLNSVETVQLLFVLKVAYPDRVFLIRGNHETRQVTSCYGFYEECQKKYGTLEVWKLCTDTFDYFPIAALVDGQSFCVHGGLSPEIQYLPQIHLISRRQEVPNEGAFCDLVWSDPENSLTEWAVSPRGAGFHFGSNVAREFCYKNKLALIARAHQLVQEGYQYHFNEEQVVTVWSAPNYCYRCGNRASLLTLYDTEEREFTVFSEVDTQISQPTSFMKPAYFL